MQSRLLLSLAILVGLACTPDSPRPSAALLSAIDDPRLSIGAAALPGAFVADAAREGFVVRTKEKGGYEARVQGSGEVSFLRLDDPRAVRLRPRPGALAFGPGVERSGRVLFTAAGGEVAVVLTPLSTGLKEDIVLARPGGDSLAMEWDLDLDPGLEARLDASGDIVIDDRASGRAGKVQIGGDGTRQASSLTQGTRPGTSPRYRSPAPVVRQATGAVEPGIARFELDHGRIRLLASGLARLSYPITIDPSIVFPRDEGFHVRGNDEGGVVISSANVKRGKPSGTVGVFASATSLPSMQNRSGHSAVAYNGHIYIIGGGQGTPTSTTPFDTVLRAKPDINNDIATWTQLGAPLPGKRRFHGSVAYNGYLYLVGGFDGTNALNSVHVAPITQSGGLGNWIATESFTTARMGHATVAANGYLYIIGGRDGSASFSDVQVAPIKADGTLGKWTATTSIGSGRADLTAAVHGDSLYVIGGQESSTVVGEVISAPLSPDGTVGQWTTTNAVLERYGHASSVHNGYLYVSGGKDSGCQYDPCLDVLVAPLLAGGGIGSFVNLGSFVNRRSFHASVVSGDFLYVVAGNNSSGQLATVERARLGPGIPGEFSKTTPLPFSTADHVVLAHNGYFYVLGGDNGSGAPSDKIHKAPINPNGTLGTFAVLPPFPEARKSFSAVIDGGYLYVIGGVGSSTGLHVHSSPVDPVTGDTVATASWTNGNDLPSARSAHTTVARNGLLYVIGGASTASEVLRGQLDGKGGVSWTKLAQGLAAGRSNHATALYGNNIIVAGGNSLSSIETTQITDTGALRPWATVQTIPPSVRSGASAVAHNGYLYFAGGDNGSSSLKTVVVAPINLDGTLGAFVPARDFLQQRTGLRAVAYNGYLYVSGGRSAPASSVLYGDVQVAAVGTAGRVGSFPTAAVASAMALPIRLAGAAGAASNGVLYVSGGRDDGGALAKDIYYSPVSASGAPTGWKTAPSHSLPTPRTDHTAVAHNGFIHFIGGLDASGSLDSVFTVAFNPTGGITGSVLSPNRMGQKRHRHASAIYKGHLYVSGGCWDENCASLRAGIETSVVDDATGSIGPFADTTVAIPTGRHGHASVAYNGQLYIIGGCAKGLCDDFRSEVLVGAINPSDGKLAALRTTIPLPSGRYGHRAVAQDGFLYVVGGVGPCSATSATPCERTLGEVLVAPIHSDGTLGSWFQSSSLSTARARHAVLTANGFLFAAGGCTGTPACTTARSDVEAAPLLTPAARGVYSKLIDLKVLTTLDELTVMGNPNLGSLRAFGRIADATGVFGPGKDLGLLQMGTAVPFSITQSARYAWLRFTMDDRLSAAVNPDAPNERDLSEITVEYGGPVGKLVFLNPADQKLKKGECSADLKLQLQDGSSAPLTVAANEKVTLSQAPKNLDFFSDSTCSINLQAEVIIPAGAHSVSVFFRGLTEGPVQISAVPQSPRYGLAATVTQSITSGSTGGADAGVGDSGIDSGTVGTDSGNAVDSGQAADSGAVDRDSGTANPADAASDAGTSSDAAPVPDSGSSEDAATGADAGRPDSGSGADAATAAGPDAGAADAGSDPAGADAAPVVDAGKEEPPDANTGAADAGSDPAGADAASVVDAGKEEPPGADAGPASKVPDDRYTINGWSCASGPGSFAWPVLLGLLGVCRRIRAADRRAERSGSRPFDSVHPEFVEGSG
jgi:N-acetylneuraminic acid mutarotase